MYLDLRKVPFGIKYGNNIDVFPMRRAEHLVNRSWFGILVPRAKKKKNLARCFTKMANLKQLAR